MTDKTTMETKYELRIIEECPRCHGNGRIEMLEHCPECKDENGVCTGKITRTIENWKGLRL